MLKVTFEEKDNKLTLSLKGHAGQAESGHDLVCASCSILAYTVAQFVQVADSKGDLKSPAVIKLESGDALIECEPSEETYEMLFNIYHFAQMGYILLWQNYPQYVELKPFGAVQAVNINQKDSLT